jgi:endo-beta-N-acetylglucosaminidase D
MTINNLKARFNTADADAITSTLSSTGTDSFAVENFKYWCYSKPVYWYL